MPAIYGVGSGFGVRANLIVRRYLVRFDEGCTRNGRCYNALAGIVRVSVMYPWPFNVDDALLDHSLRIALDYLEMTGQAEPFEDVRRRAAVAILTAWNRGVRHPIRLGNVGIMAAKSQVDHPNLQSMYPRVS
jgi:hypothetical protein